MSRWEILIGTIKILIVNLILSVHGENCYIDGLEGDPEKKMHINNINCINELGHVAKYQGISKICKRKYINLLFPLFFRFSNLFTYPS